ncbi:MAG TPA: hypothetical protein VGZ91_02875 [Candidatus Sulfotelmatobacter sp.]|jgi:hypothetical protein|nr:hypothetical protein [Candidatus Sulfotelmatobacter sp.]
MKEVAILLLVALMLNGCGSTVASVPTASGGIWSSDMFGGEGLASGLSFVTQFTVGTNGAITVSTFQLLTQTAGGCFPVTGPRPTGTLLANFNSADQVVPPFSFNFTVTSSGNTLTLTGTSMTGTLNTTNNTLSNGVITGTWTLTGGTSCNTNGTFTMTQSTSG